MPLSQSLSRVLSRVCLRVRPSFHQLRDLQILPAQETPNLCLLPVFDGDTRSMVRFKNRYMLVKLVWKDGKRDEAINEGMLLQNIRDSIQLNFGDFQLGSCLASVQVKFLCPYTGLCIIRCGRDELKEVLCSVTLMTEVKHRRILITQLHVSGTIQCCREVSLMHHARAVGLLDNLLTQQAAALLQSQDRLRSVEL